MECKVLTERHLLIFHEVKEEQQDLANSILCNFPGLFVQSDDITPETVAHSKRPDVWTYFCGNVRNFRARHPGIVFDIIEEASYHLSDDDQYFTCNQGGVPYDIHNGLGVFFREVFDFREDNFEQLTAAHQYQQLTESDKEGVSYRKGIYLSRVTGSPHGLHFSLLRCSTNLDGPTESFQAADSDVVIVVNGMASFYFDSPAPLNHVLAQTYHNSVVEGSSKKAKIKRHSDKTEDMPSNALIAFCTFYSKDILTLTKPSADDPFDRVYNKTSALTRLRFRLKDCVEDESLPKDFTLTLYPGSVFMMPIRTNRLYTHEIVPSILPVDRLPTRLGYVIRSSATDAVYKEDGCTYIEGGKIKLRQATDSDAEELKALYRKENMTDEKIDYGIIPYTLNKGDLMKPKVTGEG